MQIGTYKHSEPKIASSRTGKWCKDSANSRSNSWASHCTWAMGPPINPPAAACCSFARKAIQNEQKMNKQWVERSTYRKTVAYWEFRSCLTFANASPANIWRDSFDGATSWYLLGEPPHDKFQNPPSTSIGISMDSSATLASDNRILLLAPKHTRHCLFVCKIQPGRFRFDNAYAIFLPPAKTDFVPYTWDTRWFCLKVHAWHVLP